MQNQRTCLILTFSDCGADPSGATAAFRSLTIHALPYN